MGALLGFAVGAGLKMLGEHGHQQAAIRAEQAKNTYNFYTKDRPEYAGTPEGQKAIAAYSGPDVAKQYADNADHIKLGMQFLRNSTSTTNGPGGQQGPGFAPDAEGNLQPAVELPVEEQYKRAVALMASPEMAHLTTEQREAGNAHIAVLSQQMNQARTFAHEDALKAQYESPEAKGKLAAAEATGRIGAETSPEAIKAQVHLAAAKASAEAWAHLAADTSPAAIDAAIKKSAAEAAARIGVEGSDLAIAAAAKKAAAVATATLGAKATPEALKYVADNAATIEAARIKASTSPEAIAGEAAKAGATAGASETAKIAAGSTPDAIAAAATKAGATSEASTKARLGAELSPETTALKSAQEKELQTVRAQVRASIGKPWGEKDSLAARKSALEQAKTELTKPNRVLPGTTAPQPEALDARAKDILLSEGLDPTTGKRLEDGDMVRLPNGKVLHWRAHPAPTAP